MSFPQDDLDDLVTTQPPVADWPGQVRRRLRLLRRRRQGVTAGAVALLLVLGGTGAVFAANRTGGSSRLTTAGPTVGTTATDPQRQAVNAAVTGPVELAVGQTGTFVGHFSWSGQRPDTLVVCGHQGCVPYSTCPMTAEQPRAAKPGSTTISQDLTFATPGRYLVTAEGSSGCHGYWRGRGSGSLVVEVVAGTDAHLTPSPQPGSPTDAPSETPTPDPSPSHLAARDQELRYLETLSAPTTLSTDEQGAVRAHASWSAARPDLQFTCVDCPGGYQFVYGSVACSSGGPSYQGAPEPGSGDLESGVSFPYAGDYTVRPVLHDNCQSYYQGSASGPTFTVHVTGEASPTPSP